MNNYTTYLKFSGIAVQMGITIFLFAKLGNWLDGYYQSSNEMYTKISTMVGVFLSLYIVIVQATKLNSK
jgi:hypothetical protein